VDTLAMQVPDAWPNLFRQARFLSAVDMVQADRLRRKVAGVMAEVDKVLSALLMWRSLRSIRRNAAPV
jgi:hypothetical protein